MRIASVLKTQRQGRQKNSTAALQLQGGLGFDETA